MKFFQKGKYFSKCGEVIKWANEYETSEIAVIE
jgi:hypothetical protein